MTTLLGEPAADPAAPAGGAPAAPAPSPAAPEQGGAPAPAPEQPAAPAAPAAPEQPAADPYAGLALQKDSPLGDDDLAAIKDFAKEHGLPLAAAQALLARESERATEASTRRDELISTWEGEVRNDPDLGGANLARTVDSAKRALAAFWPPEFAKELDESGFGNHPGLLRGLSKLGAAMAEPAHLARGGLTSQSPSWSTLWPGSPHPSTLLGNGVKQASVG